MEDLTTGAASVAESQQISDLSLLGIDFDGEVLRQSQRTDRYNEVIGLLSERGLTYECFCSRREIRDAVTAPHGPTNAYPGTCASLDDDERARLRAQGRRPAVRLRAGSVVVGIHDRLHGRYEAPVDDFVLRRGDGLAAYNLAVVVDDSDTGVDHVVRGDDLLDSTPRQVLLGQLLGLPRPEYIHVPLVLGPDGTRLSKRHGAVGLGEQLRAGADIGRIRALLARSLGIVEGSGTLEPARILEAFDIDAIPREPWVLDPQQLRW